MIRTFERDTLRIEVDVTRNGEPHSLAGAQIEFVVRRVQGGDPVSAEISVPNAAGSRFWAIYASGRLTADLYAYQARITMPDGTDTIAADQINVAPSIPPEGH